MKCEIFVVLLFALLPSAYSQKNIAIPKTKIALVIGNDRYTARYLEPFHGAVRRDADSMEHLLRDDCGFTVYRYNDLNVSQLQQRFEEFKTLAKNADVALVYYSGHGVSLDDRPYMLPVDIHLPDVDKWTSQSKDQFRREGLEVNKQVFRFFNQESRKGKINFLIMDCCRVDLDLVYSGIKSINLRKVSKKPNWDAQIQEWTDNELQGEGTYVVYATGQLRTAKAGSSNSYFTAALLGHIRRPVQYYEVFQNACNEVQQSGVQIPQQSNMLGQNFVFCDNTKRSTVTQLTDNSPIEMVYVQGGTFQMGNVNSEYANEKPVHSVTLSSFSIGKYEITQKQWQDIMGSNPSSHKDCNSCPVENVSWDDIQNYLRQLNVKYSGHGFRLPTEAEWEFAARGGNYGKGNTYSGGNRLAELAFYTYNSDNQSQPVGLKKSNELDLYDMSGNVWEWCSYWYADYSARKETNPKGPERWIFFRACVLRGGSWKDSARDCRCYRRENQTPECGHYSGNLGFRVVSSL